MWWSDARATGRATEGTCVATLRYIVPVHRNEMTLCVSFCRVRLHTGAVARPRDPDLDRRILASFRELAERDGVASVSITAVAERSGVSRPAIYRRWRSRAALAIEAQTDRITDDGFVDRGSLRLELTDAVQRLAASMSAVDRSLGGPVMAQMITDEAFAAKVWERRWGPDIERMEVMWARAVERGEVRPEVDGRALMDQVVAMCIYQVALSHRQFGEDEVEQFIDRLLHGVLRT